MKLTDKQAVYVMQRIFEAQPDTLFRTTTQTRVCTLRVHGKTASETAEILQMSVSGVYAATLSGCAFISKGYDVDGMVKNMKLVRPHTDQEESIKDTTPPGESTEEVKTTPTQPGQRVSNRTRVERLRMLSEKYPYLVTFGEDKQDRVCEVLLRDDLSVAEAARKFELSQVRIYQYVYKKYQAVMLLVLDEEFDAIFGISTPKEHPLLDRDVTTLRFRSKTTRLLYSHNIRTIRQLVFYSEAELRRFYGFGTNIVDEIVRALNYEHLKLAPPGVYRFLEEPRPDSALKFMTLPNKFLANCRSQGVYTWRELVFKPEPWIRSMAGTSASDVIAYIARYGIFLRQ